ncbi:CubicO group peptidase (beta-lactamase class C family) [Paenibacillus taihuensis]|uniref:CubicO group peptidase (Beta-lactamase class C family) n=1 Tax=Paenibacillus taihuensis TaxID=1156355 RepID=A0A3D9S8I2_9BACL|nr:serine hydrolase [Paenibacillus taihuensis]REE85145.1 CubicO group peptidase (beta-lactamase class C family) [Paenibacillus taihuensis]
MFNRKHLEAILITRTELRLPRTTPEAVGIRSTAIAALLDAWKESGLELHSMMILRHGQVAAEGWWAPYAPELSHMLFSLSKSFTSSAIGLAAAEGLLSLDDAVISFFPEVAPEEPSANLSAMRVRHLLMMGTGHEEDTMGPLSSAEDGDWVRAFLQVPVGREPGTHFVYNSGATYMLSAILQKVSGVKLLDYLRPRLLDPLGITEGTWESCPRGIHTGGWGLMLTTESIAKFGQLYLQRGVWEGKRILSEEWVNEATSKQIHNGDDEANDWTQGYGYQFWRCRNGAYRGDGAFGQFCIVLPEKDTVIALTSGTNDMQGVLNGIWTHLLPALTEDVTADPAAHEALSDKLGSLTLEPPVLDAASPLESEVSGSRYVLDENQFQWTALSVQFESQEAVVTLENCEGEFVLRCGRGEWAEGRGVLLQGAPFQRGANHRMASSFTWRDSETLSITLRYIETPFYVTSELKFNGDELTAQQQVNVAFFSPELPSLHGRRS